MLTCAGLSNKLSRRELRRDTWMTVYWKLYTERDQRRTKMMMWRNIEKQQKKQTWDLWDVSWALRYFIWRTRNEFFNILNSSIWNARWPRYIAEQLYLCTVVKRETLLTLAEFMSKTLSSTKCMSVGLNTSLAQTWQCSLLLCSEEELMKNKIKI